MDKVVKNDRYPTDIITQLGGKYPVYRVPSNGHPNWFKGARTMCFVYSKHCGNFILEGYRGEVEKYLETHYTKYFCYYSMWNNGKSRGYWRFWKNKDVTISEPCKLYKRWKFEVVSREPRRSFYSDVIIRKKLYFKRMPNKWIPEFDKL